MESCIVSPVWVYWLGVLTIAKPILLVISIITGFFALVCFADEERITMPCAICLIIAIIFLLLYTFLPEKDTLIAMKVAEYATYENAGIAVNSIKEVVDYIVEAINKIK